MMLFAGIHSSLSAQELTVIAISKGQSSESYLAYGKWLQELDHEIVWMDMSTFFPGDAIKNLEKCSGLLLSGGVDVFPGRYGKEADTVRCDKPDHDRDTLEFALIRKAAELRMPVLGICRGLQILNVAHGGSLIIDIPQDKGSALHKCPDKYNCRHDVTLAEGSYIAEISKVTNGTTNTNHHQGIEILAPPFRATAWSGDGLIEAIEWNHPQGLPYLLAVQWHPERMDPSNPLSGDIGRSFIQAAIIYHQTHQK